MLSYRHEQERVWIRLYEVTITACDVQAVRPEDFPVMSNESLVQHGVGDLEEARNVGSVQVITGGAIVFGVFEARLMDVLHDLV